MIRLILVIFLLQITSHFSQAETYGDSAVHAEFDAVCTDSLFVVYFNKSALDGRSSSNRPFNLEFYGQASDDNCSTNGTSTTNIDIHSTAPMPGLLTNGTVYIGTNLTENMCGINIIGADENIIYNTTIVVTYGKNPDNPTISREEYDYYNIMCLMNRTVEQKLNGDKLDVLYRAPGRDAQNKSTEFPLTLSVTDIEGVGKSKYRVGEYLKFVLDFESTRNAKAVIQSCWASSDGSSNSFSLVTDRCEMELGSSWIGSPQMKKSEFKTEAFRFLASGSAVYVECLVRVCLTTEDTTECTLCGSKRKRRDVASITDKNVGDAFVKSKGFYIIADDREQDSPDSDESEGSEASNIFAGTNGLIVIILLSLIIFLVTVVAIKRFLFTASSRKMTTSSNEKHDHMLKYL